MALLQFIVPIITGGGLTIFLKPRFKFVHKLAGNFIFLVLLLIAGSWFYGFTCIRPVLIGKVLSFILNWAAATSNLLLGYLFVFTLTNLSDEDYDNDNFSGGKLRNTVLWGIAMLAGNSFLMASAGMSENQCSMLAFFKLSGYTEWFLYLIIAAEALGGIGLLLHFKLKTGPIAAAGLMLIMIGALYTHRHNNDPFPASFAAIRQLIMLSFVQVMYYLEKCEVEAGEYNSVELARNID